MIKRNSRFFIICCVVVLFTTTWIVLQIVWSNTESRCTVKVEDDLFSIGMESMNESRSESFRLEEGISVAVYVVHLDGELDIYITDSSRTVVYEGHNPEIGSFLVNITENDRYTMTVEGKRAKGSISFQILRNEEKTK